MPCLYASNFTKNISIHTSLAEEDWEDKMKRLIWTIVLLAFYMSVCVAQTIAEYTFSTTTDGTLQDMTGSTNFTGFNPGTYYDDTAFGITNIGFSFSLGASSYTQFSINSNGQMQLGSTAISGGQASPAANTAPHCTTLS